MESKLSISLKSNPFKSDMMEINTETLHNQCRPKLERGFSIQFEVNPKRSPVLTAKPEPPVHIYAEIPPENDYENNIRENNYASFRKEKEVERENEYFNTFTNTKYGNLRDRTRVPTLPPRNLEHHYSFASETPFHRGIESVQRAKYTDMSYFKRLDELKNEIHNQFDVIRNEIRKRENILINEIEEIRLKYILKININESNIHTIIQKMNKRHSSLNLPDSSNNFKTKRVLVPEESHLNFKLGVMGTDFMEKIGKIGKITRQKLPTYKSMSTPIRHFGKISSNVGEIEFPMGIAVDQESNIVYVVDQGVVPKVCSVTSEGKVQVFAKNFKHPHGICVKQGKIYITDTDRENRTGEVHVYNTKGKLLGKCRSEGLKVALGVSVDSDADIYVCDGESNSIQVFDSEFNFKGKIPMHEDVQPIDIQVTDTELYILAEEMDTKWCVLVFGKDGGYKQDVLNEEVQAEFGNIQFFTRDVAGNIVIADQTTHCLHVISKYGDLVVNVGEKEVPELYMPSGVDINKNNNIVTSWIHEDSALRVY